MTIKLLIIMDAIDAIQPKKDATLAILLEAQNRQWDIYYSEPKISFSTE